MIFKKNTSFEKGVNLIELSKKEFCLHHSLRQNQIFGGKSLKNTYNAVLQGKPIKDKKLQKCLFKNKFLTSSSPNRFYKNLVKEQDNLKELNPKFNLLRILLTDICNLGCDYCKVIKLIDRPRSKPVDIKKIEELVKFFFKNSVKKEPKIIHITGGEPTIFFEHVKKIIALKEKYARKGENCWIVMGTNAVALDEEKAKFLAEKDIKCIVSMDGPEKIHDKLRKFINKKGSWKAVDEKMLLLKKHGVEVSISMVIGKHTISRANEIIEFFVERYQPTGMGVNFMKPPTPEDKNYKYLVKEEDYANTVYSLHKNFRNRGVFFELVFRHLEPFVKKKFRFHDCGAAGCNNINIDAKGRIGPCKSFLLMDKLAMKKVDITEYKNTISKDWRKRSPIFYSSCEGCDAIAICGNGCAYDAFVNAGDEMNIDHRSCQYTQQFFGLFLKDLFSQIKPLKSNSDWWHLVTQEERDKVLGNVAEVENSLSYSIGHQTKKFKKSFWERDV